MDYRDVPVPDPDNDPDLDDDFRSPDRDRRVTISQLFHTPSTQTTFPVTDSRDAEPRPTGSTARGAYPATPPTRQQQPRNIQRADTDSRDAAPRPTEMLSTSHNRDSTQ